MSIPEEMRWLFWDVDTDAIDVERDESYVLGRVLERGRLADVKWVMQTYGLTRIRRFFEETGHPGVSPRTVSFWKAFFKKDGKTWRKQEPFRRSSSIF